MDDGSAAQHARTLGDALRARGWRIATAESCTGGLIAASCTAVAGSSDWFERGIVAYGNGAKTALLGVDAALIERHGAVSEPVARAMALGALMTPLPAAGGAWPVQLAVAVTGIAGPGGAAPGKPVGTVWLAWAVAAGDGRAAPPRVDAVRLQLAGDRDAVRTATVHAALDGLLRRAREPAP